LPKSAVQINPKILQKPKDYGVSIDIRASFHYKRFLIFNARPRSSKTPCAAGWQTALKQKN
jgi:hypothetical protein